jgi:hypothetical protein
VLRHEVLHEARQILAPHAQRRQRDRHHFDPVVQVFAKALFEHRLLEVLVRGGDDADAGAHRLLAAQPLERTFLHQPQQLGLGRESQRADFVEEDRAAIALLELAAPLLRGAEKGAALVAEQLAFQQRLRDRSAVHRQERALGPLAVLVHGARDQFLAGAALADQQDVGVAGGDAADELADLLHRGAAADDAVGAPILDRFGIQPYLGAHQARHLERLVDQCFHARHIERLLDEVVSTVLHGGDDAVAVAVRGDDEDLRLRARILDALQHLHAGHAGHLQVEDDEDRQAPLAGAAAPRRRRARRAFRSPAAPRASPRSSARRLRRRRSAPCAWDQPRCSGRLTVNDAPPPGTLATSIQPWCKRTI